jgi:hypothetical protein
VQARQPLQIFPWAKLPGISPRQALLLLSLCLFLFSIAIYARSLNNDFVWDDIGVFVEDPSIRDFRNIPGFFLSPLVLGDQQAGKQTVGGERIRYFRPLTSVLHVLEYRWFGTNPLGYKAVNLVLNGLVVVCAFLLARALLARTGVAFLAALLFAAIPGRGEVVYWAYSDNHILAALFSLLTVLAYHHQRRGLALLGMAVALLFQEGPILLPAVLASYEWLIAGARREEWWGFKRLLPFVLLAGGYLVLRHLAAGAPPISSLPPADMIRGMAFVLVKYARILFVPDAPVTMYLYTPGMFAAGGKAGVATLLMAGTLLLAGWVLWKLGKSWFFWYVWFFIGIAIAFNIGSYANYLLGEKSLYLSSLGPCVLLARAACSLERWRVAAIAMLLAMGAWHAGQTVARASYWANSTTYLENIIAFEPAYDVAQYQLALLAMRSGDYVRAVEQLEKVLDLRPDLRSGLEGTLADAYAELGRSLAERGDLAAAMTALQKALQYNPRRSSTWNAIGVVNFLRGEPVQAMSDWQRAVALDPRNQEAVRNLQRYAPQRGTSATP